MKNRVELLMEFEDQVGSLSPELVETYRMDPPKLYSVTQRVRVAKQPRGGFLKPGDLHILSLGDGSAALPGPENIHATRIGTTVDYLTRAVTGTDKNEAFSICEAGARMVREEFHYADMLSRVNGLDDESVRNAIALSSYDAAYRGGRGAYLPIASSDPDSATVESVREMVRRSAAFLDKFGPKTLDGITFEGGYTPWVAFGDADFLTEGTLWDFKVYRGEYSSYNTLQLLMYWRMGTYAKPHRFLGLKHLGFFNPRRNEIAMADIANIPQDAVEKIDRDVIHYEFGFCF